MRHASTNLLGVFLIALMSCGARAQGMAQSVSGTKVGDPIRLTAYEDNYAVVNQMRNNGWTAKDEAALRARISFKYSFCGPQFRRTDLKKAKSTTEKADDDTLCPTSGTWSKAEFFFGYSAEFDFYAGTRPSGPVIGRVNAPGFFARIPADALFPDGNWKQLDGFEIGVQHRSDGQTTEVTSDRDARIANERYAAGDRRFFDTISRDSDFLVFALDKQLARPPVGEALTLRAKLRLYLGRQDSDVTWGPLANTGRRFSDYDRLHVQGWWRLNEDFQADLAWRVGDRGLATDSLTVGIEVRWLGVPWYLRLHQGPMNTLSNYTQRQDSIGLGVRFAGF